jgi:hypothetical protein
MTAVDEFLLHVMAFTSAEGAMLPAGTWYPVPLGDLDHPNEPGVTRFWVKVEEPSTLVMLSNLGRLARGQWAQGWSTGVTLAVGNLIPSRIHGLTVWSGPTQTAYWRSPAATDGEGRLKLWGQLMGRSPVDANAVALGPGLIALGNPNPTNWTHFTLVYKPGLGGAANAMLLGPYGGSDLPVAAARAFWPAVSPRWLDLSDFSPPQPPGPQVPVLQIMADLGSRFVVNNGPATGVNPLRGLLVGLDRAALRRLFRDLGRELRHGWLTESELRALRDEAARGRTGRAGQAIMEPR